MPLYVKMVNLVFILIASLCLGLLLKLVIINRDNKIQTAEHCMRQVHCLVKKEVTHTRIFPLQTANCKWSVN